MVDWAITKAAVWRARKEYLKPILHVDEICLDDLVGIDRQKQIMFENTSRFLENRPYNHILLWGSRGTGKSALIKAILNRFADDDLRLIEIAKDDLKDLPDIVDEIRNVPFRFIVFCDDLSFEKGDDSYKGLKPLLEGSVEIPPKNVVVYATSNRRHLVTEIHQDNEFVDIKEQEIHYSDAIEEKISLSDRFGLWLSFYQGNMKDYLKIVDKYFKDYDGDMEELHKEAKEFSVSRASRSGRCAKQFFNFYCQKSLK